MFNPSTIDTPTSVIADLPHPRVLLATDCLGGVWTFALELAKAIGDSGGEVLLATMGRDLDESQRAEVLRLKHCTVYESTFSLEWMEDPWGDVDAAGCWLLGLEAQWRPDIIHCNTFAHAALDWKAPVVLTAHSCVYSWFQAVKGYPPPAAQWDEYFRRVTNALTSASAVVTPTRAMREALGVYPVNRDRVEVISNGRTGRAFSRSRLKLPQIFSAGRLWDAGKNTRLLDSIAPRLSWPCLVAGETGVRQSSGTLTFLGRLSASRMAARLAESAIFAHPALYEPFGLAPLEAALSRCALVLSDIPSLREVWGHSNALFVDPRNEDAWVDALEWLAADPSRCREFGERAFQRAQWYSRERMGAAYLDLYARTAALESRQLVHH